MRFPQPHGYRWVILSLLALLLFSGAACKRGIPKEVTDRLRPVALEWWGVFEGEDEMAPLIAEYQRIHPNVGITYRRFRFAEYERRVLDALAERDFRGPDILSLPSAWTREYRTKLLPLPATITMPFRELRGTVTKEVFAELRTTRTPAPAELANTFLDVIIPDAVLPSVPVEGRPSEPAVFGLPLAVDTMVLYANRDLLNAAGIPEPARTWTEFLAHVPRLTRADRDGNIVQAGAAIGTSRNVPRAFDLLSLLMMQNGAVMVSPSGEPRFHLLPDGLSGRTAPPGLDALLVYTDFARPGTPTYTWNAEQPDGLEAFLQGRAAYFFGYQYHLPMITARAPRLNLAVGGMLHLAAALDPATGLVVGSDVIANGGSTAVNAANFWLQTVAARTAYPNEAWDLLLFATTQTQNAKRFLDVTGRPTALRALVGEQLQDPKRKVFANQLLTSRTWYHGSNARAAEAAFLELIDATLAGTAEPARLLQVAAEKVAQTQ